MTDVKLEVGVFKWLKLRCPQKDGHFKNLCKLIRTTKDRCGMTRCPRMRDRVGFFQRVVDEAEKNQEKISES